MAARKPAVFVERRENWVTREEFNTLKAEVETNTELTRDIHSMVKGFKILGAIVKYVAAFAAGCVAIWHGAQAVLAAVRHH